MKKFINKPDDLYIYCGGLASLSSQTTAGSDTDWTTETCRNVMLNGKING